MLQPFSMFSMAYGTEYTAFAINIPVCHLPEFTCILGKSTKIFDKNLYFSFGLIEIN